VVAAVSSVTSLLRAGGRSPPTVLFEVRVVQIPQPVLDNAHASNLPPAGHDEKHGAPPAAWPCASPRSPSAPPRPGRTPPRPVPDAMKPGSHGVRTTPNPGFTT